MTTFARRDDFMSGVYVIRFATAEKASTFVERYAGCPVWPIIAMGTVENEVAVVALELVAQRHGEFSQDRSTLVSHPEFLEAEGIRFLRDDRLLDLFPNHSLTTGYTSRIPCGSDCPTCDSFGAPCRGCPAFYAYGPPQAGAA